MEFRNDLYLCEKSIEDSKSSIKKGEFLDGFKKGFYNACFIKNKEINDLNIEIGRLKRLLIKRLDEKKKVR